MSPREVLAVPHAARLDDLTARERTILKGIGQGFTNGEIARRYCRSIETVRSQVRCIHRKLGTDRRAVLVVFAITSGLVLPEVERRAPMARRTRLLGFGSSRRHQP